MMNLTLRVATAAALATLAATAQAAPLRTLANLQSITVYETTSATVGTTFAVNAGALLTRLSGSLTDANSDFSFFPNEDYDVYYSNADGSFNADGGYLTIEAVWRNNQFGQGATYGSMNINEVTLDFIGGGTDFGDFTTTAVLGSYCDTGQATHCILGSAGLAADGNLGTMPRFGATSLVDASERMRLTIGFDGISAATVPLPGAVWLLATAIAGLAGAGRRRGAGERA